MSLTNKIILGYLSLEFLNGFFSKRNEINEQVVKDIVECDYYQELIAIGKSPQEISVILDIKNMTKERYEILTGKSWPQ